MRRTARPDALARAKARLDTLDLYPEPVDVSNVCVLVAPWLFVWRFRPYHGLATRYVIYMRERDYGDDLLVHELCHVWQSQHDWRAVWREYLFVDYEVNRYEVEARCAVELTRPKPVLTLLRSREVG